jgi:hypothetical protein
MSLFTSHTLSKYAWLLTIAAITLFSCDEKNATEFTRRDLYKGLSFVGSPELPEAADLDSVCAIGANAISLMPFAYLNSESVEIIYLNGEWQWKGETEEGIAKAVQLAQERGIRCMLKPQLWIDQGTFTGYFALAQEDQWKQIEEDYTAFILRFAVLSERYKLPVFCIATELDRWASERPEYWQQLIQNIRSVYSGQLTYACNWDGAHKIPFWTSLDYIGIDAYHPLSHEKTPSVSQLKIAWDSINHQFTDLHQKYNKPILFTEWGYQACDHPTKEPWLEDASIATNEIAQSNCYRALWEHCSDQPWFAGGFVWKWFPPNGREPSQEYERYSPQGRLAAETLEQLFK